MSPQTPSSKLTRRLFLNALAMEAITELVPHGAAVSFLKELVTNPSKELVTNPSNERSATKQLVAKQPEKSDPFDWIGAYPRVDLPAAVENGFSQVWNTDPHKKLWQNYLETRKDFIPSLNAVIKNEEDGADRAILWFDLIHHTKSMRSPLAQAQTIFKWIRQNINYDHDKLAHEDQTTGKDDPFYSA